MYSNTSTAASHSPSSTRRRTSATNQGLTLVHGRAQHEQTGETFMGHGVAQSLLKLS
jgi:hypothetical protein